MPPNKGTDAVVVEEVASDHGRAAGQFIDFPHQLYRGCDNWVPRFRRDVRAMLARRHPFFKRGHACFFVASRNGRALGTIAAIENASFNLAHRSRIGHFHFFDCVDDGNVSRALFAAAFDWLRSRGMQSVAGPFGFGFMGAGALVDGFEHRAAMTMMAYNYPYYARLFEGDGLTKYKDQYSMFIDAAAFRLPDKVRRVAEIALKRGSFEVPELRSKKDLRRRAQDIGRVYNESFQSHGDDFTPLSEQEIAQISADLVAVADPSLIKLLVSKGSVAGFLFGFPDLSAAIQRSRGRITPWSVIDLLLEYRRADRLIINGAGILPQHQRLGGNALLYFMMENVASRRRFVALDAVQVMETTELMLADLKTLGGRVFKVHRIYQRSL